MIILGCFGGTPIFGNTHIDTCLPVLVEMIHLDELFSSGWFNHQLATYCWWTNSCNSRYGRYHRNYSLNRPQSKRSEQWKKSKNKSKNKRKNKSKNNNNNNNNQQQQQHHHHQPQKRDFQKSNEPFSPGDPETCILSKLIAHPEAAKEVGLAFGWKICKPCFVGKDGGGDTSATPWSDADWVFLRINHS